LLNGLISKEIKEMPIMNKFDYDLVGDSLSRLAAKTQIYRTFKVGVGTA
jgi:hypothetical protein